jgi:DNA primase
MSPHLNIGVCQDGTAINLAHAATGDDDPRSDPLVEGELDCVTLWQHGYWPAVSTTTGAGSFKVAWYDAIVAFDPKEIVICYDSDTAGQKGAEALLKKFEDRLVKNIVLPEAKDANEYFGTHSNADFDALLKAAHPPELENAKSMTTVLNMLQEQLWFSANAFDGVPSMFDEVNTMIAGGYWRGQLVTISGSSGTGKTSYVLQELLTMAKQGHPAYLLCLEIPEVMMMRKSSRRNTASR